MAKNIKTKNKQGTIKKVVKKTRSTTKKVVAKKISKTYRHAASVKAKPKTTSQGKKPLVKKVKVAKASVKVGKKTKPAATSIANKLAKVQAARITTKTGELDQLKIKPYAARSGEEYMNDVQRKHFENLLLAWKKQLMEEVDRTIKDMQEDVTRYPDILDLATQEEEFRLKLRERDRERKLLKKIDEALERLAEGNYGYCNDCGAEIGIRRLEARPTATQCVECKSIAELKEKQIGS